MKWYKALQLAWNIYRIYNCYGSFDRDDIITAKSKRTIIEAVRKMMDDS